MFIETERHRVPLHAKQEKRIQKCDNEESVLVSFHRSKRSRRVHNSHDGLSTRSNGTRSVHALRFSILRTICYRHESFLSSVKCDKKTEYIYEVFHHSINSQPKILFLAGKIESGLPKIALPPFSAQVGNQTYTFLDMCAHYGSGIVIIPLISILANVAIAKAFGID